MSDIFTSGFAFGMPGGTEWMIILIIALLLFGKRLPEIMRGLGGSVKEFKKGMEEGAPSSQTPPAPPVDGAVSRGQTQATSHTNQHPS